ncbi:FAD binding domain-containing protein [Spirosoma gilvum]
MIGIQLTYKAPESLKEALDLIGREGHQVLTADQSLINGLKKGTPALHTLVSLRKIPGLATINVENNELRLGTSVSYNDLLKHPALNQYPILAQALSTISDPHLRHHSALGSTLNYGGPDHASVLAALMALDATAVVLTRDQDIRLPIHYFSQNGSRVMLPQGGLLTGIVIPNASLKTGLYLSLKQLSGRPANHGIAVSITQSGRIIDQARLVLAGFTEQPLRLESIEEALKGNVLTPNLIARVVEQLKQAKLPILDTRVPEGYQRHLANVVVNRALTSLAEQVK